MTKPTRLIASAFAALCLTACDAPPAASDDTPDRYSEVWPAEARIERVIDGTTVCRVVGTGSVCGVDRWTMTVHKDESRVLRITADDFTYNDTRYVTLHLASDGKVREAHIISHVFGDFFGSINARMEDGMVALSYLNPDGAAQDVVTLPEGIVSLGTGPAPADGWHFWSYDLEAGGAQPSATYWIGSPARGDMHGQLTPASDKTWNGQVDLEMPYGSVEADAFSYSASTTVWVDPTDRYLHRMDMNLGERGHYIFETVDLDVTEWSDLIE